MAYYSSFEPSLLFLICFFFATSQARDSIATHDHLHFFIHENYNYRPHGQDQLHENYNYPNPTAITVVGSATSNPRGFGSIVAFDDQIREGSSADSKIIGFAQGIAPEVSLGQRAWLGLLSIVFLDGKYNGSSLTLMGQATLEGATERTIIGGTGIFRSARGYTVNTLLSGTPAGYLIIECDAYIMH
ncbi:dirigent protein 22-like [Zingiber officinale]|uniref:dirigent protein 22-like n=1 Tax=Zingiber officinale TaxID=94328 RepID=UPI001C4C8E2D|nr:dirigent protein 22-like [Zingiber officinale]